MIKKMLLLGLLTLFFASTSVYATEGSPKRGGHYTSSKGSSHKGGHYKNAKTNNHYTKRK